MDKNGGSRLLQMQARFQQKQMAEREMKIASLYEAQQARALGRVRQSPTGTSVVNTASSSPPAHAPVVPGKVRQMFEERRTKAGIDKSYPLQPIHNTDRVAPRKTVTNGVSRMATNGTTKYGVNEKRTTRTQIVSKSTHSVKKYERVETATANGVNANGSGDLNHNHEPDDNDLKNRINNKTNGYSEELDEVDRGLNNYRLEDETFPEALAPIPTPRTPETRTPEHKKPKVKSPAPRSTQKTSSGNNNASLRVPSDNSITASKTRGVMQRTTKPIPKKTLGPSTLKARSTTAASAHSGVTGGGEGTACTICGRRFAEDRIQKHEEICRKANTAKKRKPFDALKHRLAGTEAEPFINKLRKSTTNQQAATNKKPLNSNWRNKHEEFIQAIRAAKQVQAHLNAGGKLSDLPPPPPSENPDYVQCPHCNRRFNQGAAERHIPKCATFQFNKPKPQAQAGRRR